MSMQYFVHVRYKWLSAFVNKISKVEIMPDGTPKLFPSISYKLSILGVCRGNGVLLHVTTYQVMQVT